jgi:hypothetical protein
MATRKRAMANAMEAARNARADTYEAARAASKEAARAAWRAEVLDREASRAKVRAREAALYAKWTAEDAAEARGFYDEGWRVLDEDEAVQGPLCEEELFWDRRARRCRWRD